MKAYAKKYIYLVALLLMLIIWIQLNFLMLMVFELKGKEAVSTIEQGKVISKANQIDNWKLKIPKIELSTQITEGTTEEIINNGIGHFKETPQLEGNIALIAGSNGYKENYFARLEELQIGDIILYNYGEQQKQYQVAENVIIEQTDWSYLSNTKENKITLITGIIGEPTKRRCVQATEII